MRSTAGTLRKRKLRAPELWSFPCVGGQPGWVATKVIRSKTYSLDNPDIRLRQSIDIAIGVRLGIQQQNVIHTEPDKKQAILRRPSSPSVSVVRGELLIDLLPEAQRAEW